jgi:hypothetical protein
MRSKMRSATHERATASALRSQVPIRRAIASCADTPHGATFRDIAGTHTDETLSVCA